MKSMPCLIKKASRCVTDRMSKTTFVYLTRNFQRSYEKTSVFILVIIFETMKKESNTNTSGFDTFNKC